MTSPDNLRTALRSAGVAALYGDPIDGVPVVPVADLGLAGLLATTHGRVTGTTALVVIDGHLALPSPSSRRIALDDAVDLLPDALGVATVDLEVPADVIGAVRSAERATVLAGPGVVAEDAVPGLHAVAAAGRLGVLNTWGAKGVFDWRSRHHLATAGLQALDFALGGLPESDLVIATGIDAAEAPAGLWSSTPSVTVAPRLLDTLSEHLSPRAEWRPVPELRTRLAAVTQDGWADGRSPAAPSAVTRNYGTVLGRGGRVSADPGHGGFWTARTFSTVELGSAQVPGRAVAGFAAASALVTRLRDPHRPVLAVVDELSDETHAVMDLADSLALGFGVEVWSADGDRLTPEQHLHRLRHISLVEHCEIATLATAPWQLDRIVEAAGPVIAWGGLTS